MCGRFTLTDWEEYLLERADLQEALPQLRPRYNIAPSQGVLTVVPKTQDKGLATLMRWGLVPSWAKDLSISYKMINARSETLSEKPSFKAAFKRRRCLIPTTGYYEWRKEGKIKVPTFIYHQQAKVFSMAGLWERWESPAGDVLFSCTIVTTSASQSLGHIHQRMPVILQAAAERSWLNPETPMDELQALMKPLPDGQLNWHEVSTLVNSPKNEHADCLKPV